MGNVAFSVAHQLPVLYNFLDTGKNTGEFPLHKACEEGDFYKIRAQIDQKSDLSSLNEQGETVLQVAARSSTDDPRILDLLMTNQLFNYEEVQKAIQAACEQGNKNNITYFIDRRWVFDYLLLSYITDGKNDNVELLEHFYSYYEDKYENDLSANQHLIKSLETSLGNACQRGNLKSAAFLIKMGANPLHILKNGGCSLDLLSDLQKKELHHLLSEADIIFEHVLILLAEVSKSKPWEEIAVIKRMCRNIFVRDPYRGIFLQHFYREIETKTGDLYYPIDPLTHRVKNLGLICFFVPILQIGVFYQIVNTVVDIAKVMWQTVSLLYSREVKQAFIQVTWEFPKALANRIQKLIFLPLHGGAFFIGALYGIIYPRKGLTFCNKLIDRYGADSFHLPLKFLKLRKLGNLKESKVDGVPEFYRQLI